MNGRLARLQRLAELHRQQHAQAVLQVRRAHADVLSVEDGLRSVEAGRRDAQLRCLDATGVGDREAWLLGLAEAEFARVAARHARQQLEAAHEVLLSAKAGEGAARMRHRQIDAVRETVARDVSNAAGKAEEARMEEIARMMRSAAAAHAAQQLRAPGTVQAAGEASHVKEPTASLDA